MQNCEVRSAVEQVDRKLNFAMAIGRDLRGRTERCTGRGHGSGGREGASDRDSL